jgi:hypothetical protein
MTRGHNVEFGRDMALGASSEGGIMRSSTAEAGGGGVAVPPAFGPVASSGVDLDGNGPAVCPVMTDGVGRTGGGAGNEPPVTA